MSGVVALWGRPRIDADGTELLRWLVAAVTAGRPVTVVDLVGADLLGEDVLADDDEAEALCAALVAAGARFVRLDAGSDAQGLLVGVLAGAGALHRLAPPERAGVPPVLLLDTRGAPAVEALLQAGQVALAPRA